MQNDRMIIAVVLAACLLAPISCIGAESRPAQDANAPATKKKPRIVDYSYVRKIWLDMDHYTAVVFDVRTGKQLRNLPIVPLAHSHFSSGLRPAQPAGSDKIGYIDAMGNWLIRPQFDGAMDFSEGRARVKVGDKVGVIDSARRWVVEPGKYEDISCFFEGLAWVCTNDPNSGSPRIGFIGIDGRMAIEPIFHDVWAPFSEGLCAVYGPENTKDEGWIYSDRLGKPQFKPYVSHVKDGRTDFEGVRQLLVFTDGLAGFMTIEPGPDKSHNLHLFGFMSRKGEVVIKPRFKEIQPFSEGLACCVLTREQAGLHRDPNYSDTYDRVFGVIDIQGRIVVPFKYDDIGPFCEGLAAFSEDGGLWGYMDRTGKVVIPARFSTASSFEGGFATVSLDGKIVIIDRTGRVIIRTNVKGGPVF